jgi:3-hydroxymyristoyl/3-hydroxydecanoyl-(acyl carrier protein) dehydratase
VEVYGSTETGGIAHRSVMEAMAPPPWQALPNVEVRLDAKENLLTVKSPFLPDNNWFRTGDRAQLHPKEHFTLEGRADRIVKIEEQRVSLVELEQRLADRPEVEFIRVIALSSETTKRQILGAVIEPSSVGWEFLATSGRSGLSALLRDALKPYFAPAVLPRRWRFVRRLPEDNRGKTSEAALAVLFAMDQDRCIHPVIVREESEEKSQTLHLKLPKDLFYFQGHFDEAPLLAGVVQVDWAIDFAMKKFAIPNGFNRIEKLKFFKVLTPGASVTLHLSYDPENAWLEFNYGDAATKYSSGRVVFEGSL